MPAFKQTANPAMRWPRTSAKRQGSQGRAARHSAPPIGAHSLWNGELQQGCPSVTLVSGPAGSTCDGRLFGWHTRRHAHRTGREPPSAQAPTGLIKPALWKQHRRKHSAGGAYLNSLSHNVPLKHVLQGMDCNSGSSSSRRGAGQQGHESKLQRGWARLAQPVRVGPSLK